MWWLAFTGAGKCSDSFRGVKRSSCSDEEEGIRTKCQQVGFYLQFLGLLHTIKSLLLLQTLQFLFSWAVKLFHQQTQYKLSMTSLEDLWFLSSLNSHHKKNILAHCWIHLLGIDTYWWLLLRDNVVTCYSNDQIRAGNKLKGEKDFRSNIFKFMCLKSSFEMHL